MEYDNTRSKQLMDKARKNIAGGANSTMRVMPYQLPLFIKNARGAKIWDVDGNELIDMNMGYGPLLFGHKPDFLIKAIKDELDIRGSVLGFPHELSSEAAELIKESYPSIDMLRFASTGTEVCQTAVRLARAFTGKTHMILFEGHYHGSTDSVFHKYHADVDELKNNNCKAISGTAGMNGAPFNAFIIPWNNKEVIDTIINEHKDKICGIMMEPVMGNAGVIPPDKDYLQYVRSIADSIDAILIFDEIITGFRVAMGGAQERYNVQSDITLFSKAIAGGVPISAIGGKAEIMDLIADGTVFHGGVYSGHPMSMAGCLATQKVFKEEGKTIYTYLEKISRHLSNELREIFKIASINAKVSSVGPMLSLHFLKGDQEIELNDYRKLAMQIDFKKYINFQHLLQQSGVFVHPNTFEPWFLSTAHTEEIIEELLYKIKHIITTNKM